MQFLLDFQVFEYGESMTQLDVFKIWAEESAAALQAKQAGVLLDIWKCVGERRVIAIANVDSFDALDQILFSLPIMQKMGQYVQLKVTPLRSYESFGEDIKNLIDASPT